MVWHIKEIIIRIFHARFLSENKKLNIYVIITETYGSPLFTSYCGLATYGFKLLKSSCGMSGRYTFLMVFLLEKLFWCDVDLVLPSAMLFKLLSGEKLYFYSFPKDGVSNSLIGYSKASSIIWSLTSSRICSSSYSPGELAVIVGRFEIIYFLLRSYSCAFGFFKLSRCSSSIRSGDGASSDYER